MSLYLALRARLVQHSDDVLAGLSCVVLCAAVCCGLSAEQSSPVVSAGADTAAVRAGCWVQTLLSDPVAWLPQLTTHSWLADPAHCCRHRTFAPSHTRPSAKTAVAYVCPGEGELSGACVRGGGKCRVPGLHLISVRCTRHPSVFEY